MRDLEIAIGAFALSQLTATREDSVAAERRAPSAPGPQTLVTR
jgi:hypothetical protein